MNKISDSSIPYWRDRPHVQGADLVLRNIMLELVKHTGSEQARALCYSVGVRIAAEMPLGQVDKLSDMELAARKFFAVRDWGWLRIEERDDAVDFLHGCSPLRAWFGETSQPWAGGLFEGFYAEWLRQMGAGEKLELRQIDSPPTDDDVMCFRLTHESRFKT